MNFHTHTHSSNCNKPEMAEIVVEATVQMLLEKLVALAAEEIVLFRGFKNDLESLDMTLKMIQEFMNDALKRDIEKELAVKQWLRNLDDVAYEADNLLDVFNYEILRRKVEIESQVKWKVCCSFSLSFLGRVAFRRQMGHKIKDLNTKLKIVDEKAERLGIQARVAVLPDYVPPVMETNSIAVDPIFIGRDDVASKIVDDIIKCSDELEVSVVPIVGMGGLGKTTLARKVFNDQSIQKHFDKRIWVSVSKKIDNKDLLVKVWESSSQEIGCQSSGEEAIIQKLRSKLKDTRYLLVLDDYLNDEKHEWDCFRNCVQGISSSKGNFIIVTTRHQNVASTTTARGECSLLVLSDDECWEIIKAITFSNLQVPDQEFEAIGKEIACRCGGLPLAANVVGGSLQGKEIDYWRSFLESSNSNPDDDVVLKILKVSFDRLPTSLLKKCFTYCSIFLKGEVIWRDRLIQLWMAEGFLSGSSETSDRDMESCGDNVYNILLQNYFLHEAVKDNYGRIEYSKMHDLVHDLSCSVARVDRDDSRVRYLAVDYEHDIKKEQAIYLRSLFLKEYKANDLINTMFLDCKYLHVLDLQRTHTEELTSSIDKLIHLRFLDLSFNSIKRLPDSVCKLFNLQTLRLVNCHSLIELPDRFKLLVGLRHLVLHYDDLFDFRRMPLEIGKLTSLRTLDFFIAGNEEGRRIGELRNLKNLRGKLRITNLEEVRGKEEAKEACLVEKQNLDVLELKWSPPSSREGNNNDYEVLEGLQPPQNLKRLYITNFGGDDFPLWTMRMVLPKLTKIFLTSCEKCQEMPTLGHLRHLKILEVGGLCSVRSIGPSFYQNSDEESSRSGVAFPALERLKLWEMENLTKWVEAPNTGATAFPKLESLEILRCRQLTTAPSHAFPSLRKLVIRDVESEVPLTKICSNSGSLEELSIFQNSNLTSLPDTLFYNNRRLQRLYIGECNNLRQLELSDAPKYLDQLIINKCSNLASIECRTTDYLSPLSHLTIIGCPMLAGLPSEMLKKRTSMENLDNGMDWLNKLKSLHIGPLSEETGMNETLKGLHELQSLCKLLLQGTPYRESLPDQLQHLTALTDLSLCEFGIEALPEWFSNMSSLNILWVYRCKKLMDLTCLQHLTKLKKLYIGGCRLIAETLTDPSTVAHRSQWAHISHIPDIYVNTKKIQFQCTYMC